MSYARGTFLVLLLVLACGLLISTRLGAQEGEFYGTSGQPYMPLGGRLVISVAPGWGLYSMRDLNKYYIDDFAKEAGIFDDNIRSGPNLYGEISYFVTPSISAGFGLNYLRGRIEEKSWQTVRVEGVGILPMRVENSLTTSAIAPQLVVRYHFAVKDLDLFSGAGVALCWGKASINTSTRIPDMSILLKEEDRFTAQGTGLLGCVGLSHDITDQYSIGAEIGYRHFPTGVLEREGGEPWAVEYSGTTHKIKQDFNGAYMLVSLSMKL